MTFQLTDDSGEVVEPAAAEDFALTFARRRTAETGKPLFVQRFLHNEDGELVPCGDPVQVGVEATP